MITIRSHVARPLMFPYPPTGITQEIVAVLPGENQVRDEVLLAFAEHTAVRPYLFAGEVGGLEIVAVDGQPAEELGGHAAALAVLYPGRSAEELVKLVEAEQARVAREQQASAAMLAAGQKKQSREQEYLSGS